MQPFDSRQGLEEKATVMKKNLLLLLLAFLSFSCFDKDQEPAVLPSGTYVGQFQRSSPTADYDVANVTLVLDGSSFSGSSDHVKYPAIGQGTYQMEGQEIVFKDNSFWTAEFDWTLILDGAYVVSTQNQEVTFIRKRGDITDVYRLRLQQPE